MRDYGGQEGVRGGYATGVRDATKWSAYSSFFAGCSFFVGRASRRGRVFANKDRVPSRSCGRATPYKRGVLMAMAIGRVKLLLRRSAVADEAGMVNYEFE